MSKKLILNSGSYKEEVKVPLRGFDLTSYIDGKIEDGLAEADNLVSNYTLYVDKRFTGKAGVTITSTGLTSVNASYNAQLATATVGVPNKPYPCIWSAQVIAKQLVALGNKVKIVVQTNNVFTVGSTTTTQNGNSSADPSINEEADIKIANIAADFTAASLGQNGITYHFEPNTKIINICKSYAIPLFHRVETVINTSVLNTAITGKGQFVWLYGQGQGFSCIFLKYAKMVNLNFTFEADLIMYNQWNSFYIEDFQNVTLNFDKLYMSQSGFSVISREDWLTAGRKRPLCSIKIRDFRRGISLFTGLPMVAVQDDWATNEFYSNYGATFNIDYERFETTTIYPQDGVLLRTQQNGGDTRFSNNTINLKVATLIGNLINYSTYVVNNGSVACWLRHAHAGDGSINVNNHIMITIGNGFGNMGLRDHYGGTPTQRCSNSSYTLNVTGTFRTTGANAPLGIGYVYASTTLEKDNQHTFRGRFVSYGSAPAAQLYSFSGVGAATIQGMHFDNVELIQKTATKAALDLGSMGDNCNVFLDNVKLVNDGTSELISKSTTNGPMKVLVANSLTNGAPISANITIEGDAFKTNTRLTNILQG